MEPIQLLPHPGLDRQVHKHYGIPHINASLLLVGRCMESVLGVHEHRRGLNRSISGCVCQCVTTMLYFSYFRWWSRSSCSRSGSIRVDHPTAGLCARGWHLWHDGDGVHTERRLYKCKLKRVKNSLLLFARNSG